MTPRSFSALLLLPLFLELGACKREPIGRTRPPLPPVAPSTEVKPVAPNVQNCGRERNVHGKGYDAAARQCFWQAYERGSAAHLSITVHTIEGDPIRYELETVPPSSVDVEIDSRDRFGAQGKSMRRCRGLSKQEAGESRFGFRLDECQPRGHSDAAAEQIAIP
jgi:hypothetical protein